MNEKKVEQETAKKAVNIVQCGTLKVGDCPFCGKRLLNNEDNRFCGMCGKAVKWD